MKQYKKINNLVGWIIFFISATVYCLTVEPAASFWDCPEFITAAFKLEVGHPPGAPFFMLLGNFFSQFASDASQVAKMINLMSALMSAGCILFLFWSITHLVRKLIVKDEGTISRAKIITIIGSGVVGALTYTFSDTFWFSAVEAEVYASSSFFTAIVFWLILKWEECADNAHSDRWLILIAYLTGLSIGVHLLNLLCLPAIVLVYYYKKNPNANLKGSLLALFGSAVLVAVVLYGMIPGIVKVGGWFELFFVNTLKMPFNSGTFFYIILTLGTIIWGIYESYTERSRKKMAISFILTVALLGIPFYGYGLSSLIIGAIIIALLAFYLAPKNQERFKEKFQISSRTLNTSLLCIMMIVIGYSSYSIIVIRSMANPPMDQNSPEDVFSLGKYLNREQYGTRPLFYGQTFSSEIALDIEDDYCVPRKIKTPSRYIRKIKESKDEKDSYQEMPGRIDYEYAQNVLFPRMYSKEHANLYKEWVDITGTNIPYNRCGENIVVNIPTFWENMKFFFSYQINYMYWRYFMWNFAGRQNDIQGNGDFENGNWITGISFIDNILVGNQELLPQALKENKGRNVYYCLPLILGLIGLFWQAQRGEKGIKQFWVVFFLFFMTGLAIAIYLNQTPSQPRERDYAYVGSFYAFAIWIGMGVAGIIEFLQQRFKTKHPAISGGVVLLSLLIPLQMAGQNWDDHDRSGRYLARDFGQNYLNTTQEEGNPILFTNGDNDTFPVWYNQDVENVRTDCRPCNLSYLQTDWYIDQMRRPAYNAPGLPIHWDKKEYKEGTNELVRVRPGVKEELIKMYQNAENKLKEGDSTSMKKLVESFGENPFELKNIIKYWVLNKKLNIIPTDSIVIRVDKEAVKKSGMKIPEGQAIPEYLNISLKGKTAVYKNQLMMLELLANTNWERPLYIAMTVGNDNYLGLEDYFIQEGLAYRFTPFNNKELGTEVDSEKMFDNLVHKFKYGGLDNPNIYIDENAMRMCYTHRNAFAQLIRQLLKEGKKEKALEALTFAEKNIPSENVPYDWSNGALYFAEAYYILGEPEKGDAILDKMANKNIEYMIWYLSLDNNRLAASSQNFMYQASVLDAEVKLMEQYDSKLHDHYSDLLHKLYDKFIQIMK